MTKSTLRQILISVFACGATASIFLALNYQTQKKIAVVDAIQLFNDYNMKKELEGIAGGKLTHMRHIADSLKSDLMGKSKMKDYPRPELEQLYREQVKAQAALEQEYQESNQSINEQVWKRLNPLIDQFGKEQGLRLIIGANGMGSVLYNDKFYDRTKELTEYVNKKYEQGL